MSRKIIGVTVGTPISPSKIEKELKPVKTVNGTCPDDNGNVAIDLSENINTALAQAKESGEFDGRGIVDVKRTSGTGAAGTVDTYTIFYSDDTTSTFAVYNGANGKDGSGGSGGGGTGADGEDGATFTPYVDANGNLSWTNDKGLANPDTVNIRGPKGDDGSAGKDGQNGSPGKDGVSVTHNWSGTTLTVTSASGTSSVDLKGNKGDTGASGYSPVRGTDYWTASDIAEIKSYVDNAILGGAW